MMQAPLTKHGRNVDSTILTRMHLHMQRKTKMHLYLTASKDKPKQQTSGSTRRNWDILQGCTTKGLSALISLSRPPRTSP